MICLFFFSGRFQTTSSQKCQDTSLAIAYAERVVALAHQIRLYADYEKLDLLCTPQQRLMPVLPHPNARITLCTCIYVLL